MTTLTSSRAVHRLRAAGGPLQRHRRRGVAAVVVAAAAYGLLAGWWTPRGPISTTEALTAIAVSLVVGVFAGVVMRTRWAMLLAPPTFAIVFELTRIGTVGPMVDGIRPGSPFGILALVLGRGLHGVLALAPMLLGAALGAGLARRLDGRPARRGRVRVGLWARRTVAALAVVALLALTAGISRNASTDPMAADGAPLAGSVAELTRENLFVEEYTLLEQLHAFASFFDVFTVLYPQLPRCGPVLRPSGRG